MERPLVLEGAEEAFDDGVVEAIAFVTEDRDEPSDVQAHLIDAAGVLDPLVTVVDQPGAGRRCASAIGDLFGVH